MIQQFELNIKIAGKLRYESIAFKVNNLEQLNQFKLYIVHGLCTI